MTSLEQSELSGRNLSMAVDVERWSAWWWREKRKRDGTIIRSTRTRWSEDKAILIKGMTKINSCYCALTDKAYMQINEQQPHIYIYNLNPGYLQRNRVVYSCYFNNDTKNRWNWHEQYGRWKNPGNHNVIWFNGGTVRGTCQLLRKCWFNIPEFWIWHS